MVMGPVEHLFQSIYKNIQNHSDPSTHHLTPSSTVNMMIPTPGIPQSASINSIYSSSVDNHTSSTFGAGMMPETTKLLPASNSSAEVGRRLISNGYQPTSCTNLASSASALPQELSQMIPTPIFNNIETLCVDSEDSNGGGFSNINSVVTSRMQQQKQYGGSQSGNFLNIGGHIGAGIRSNMQQSPAACGFSNGCMNGGIGLLGSNSQILTDSATYNFSPKSLQQHFGQPQHQSVIASLPQQVLPVLDGNYALRPANVASSASRYGPSSPVLSSSSNPNMNTRNIGSQFRINPTVLNHQENMKELQPLARSQVSIHPQKVNSQVMHEPVAVSHDESFLPRVTKEAHSESERSMPQSDYHRQVKWLLFLFHARKCSYPAGACPEGRCVETQKLVRHMEACNVKQCKYPRCWDSRKILFHFKQCRSETCSLCGPARKFLIANSKKSVSAPLTHCSVSHINGSQRRADTVRPKTDIQQSSPKRMKVDHMSPSVQESERSVSHRSINGTDTVRTKNDIQQSSPRRMKVNHMHASSQESETSLSVPFANLLHVNQKEHYEVVAQNDLAVSTIPESTEAKIFLDLHAGKENSASHGCNIDGSAHVQRPNADAGVSDEVDCHVKQEFCMTENEINQKNAKAKLEMNDSLTDPSDRSKSGKPKVKGVSLTELFTPEQIRDHIAGLRKWFGQSKAKAEKNQAMEHLMSENSCQLCAVERLNFEPTPIYCSPCGARIKRNATYYSYGSGETRQFFCILCYNQARGDTIEVDGTQFQKAKFEKKRNDEETEESWVQCDKCEAWQHQICALFNGRRNDGGQAEYTCPKCYVEEVERGERTPLPQNAVLGAMDLPRTVLSDHIEQRLFKRLKQEKQDRARQLGKDYDEVPGVEGLVVRVVSSVDKKLEVKQQYLELFKEENCPTEFPYKSKAILLFQKIEGVEVCLFGMYVQEFGSECPFPNQRRIYLSYLDSVKYFRPEIKTVTGEALRTFVYHEILIGYLEYSKKRGFTSCYIWACPPLKGEDYILYCHPEIQKTPKSDKLREYLSMLRKATAENIVIETTNLYDHFFISMGESKAKVTASRLPYFDGDYWPGAAEDMINQLRQEEDGRKQTKGKIKKMISKRTLKAAGHTDLSGNFSKDALLMQKLGETICPMKEDFIMVHLQHACTHCSLLMVSGTRWVCNQCKKFQLCDKCHDAEQRLDVRDRHPVNSRDKHNLYPVEINDVAADTKDEDEILESEFFDTRHAFLSLCQGNHYQYDTLRRAKHSSMMVLYHLHNPTAPAFVTTCRMCHHDIEAGQSWHCETCPDFDVCSTCYQNEGSVDHPHRLTNQLSMSDRNAQNKEARQQRVLQLRTMLDLLVHASQCRYPHCQYPNCRKVKKLFRHGMQCRLRASGGCNLCKRMWYLLQLHARACRELECTVPRCKDLKEHFRRSQKQSESRRRAAVMEMMRQRATEVASANTG
ncbi:Histone acetyltransferase HAC1 [Ananas comosus]|uniref:histone acetyltransferase n=1 Tax=Ananas comosus TaxID=4615 RepID=A0A199UWM1_ANACO|nr:Histone acetyltransferase HAC1 [Ananas comosus]